MKTCSLHRAGEYTGCGAEATHVWHSMFPGVPWSDRLEPGAPLPLICDEHAAMLTEAEADPLPGYERRTKEGVEPCDPIDAATVERIDAAMLEAGAVIVPREARGGRMKTWQIVALAAAGTLGIAHAQSKAKCRARQRELARIAGTTDEAKLREAAKALGVTYPDCSGFTLFREGV